MALRMNLHDLLSKAGIQPKHLDAGHQRLPCPHCDDRPRKGPREALVLLIDSHGATWHCHRCGWEGPGHLDEPITDAPQQAPKKRLGFTDYAAEIWRESKQITSACTAARYLLGRRCLLPPRDSDLRWHSSLKHPSGAHLPALVGLVTHVHTKQRLGLHRTWVKPDGSGKADVADPKRYLCSPLGDGVVRIFDDEWVTTGLGIAEGIETALSLAKEFTPVWCCLDAGHIAKFPVLAGIDALTIAMDHDDAGVHAAKHCARRWADAGREVTIVRSMYAGHDLNDEVQR
jgi:putative DNA primase/helicase